MTVLTLPFNSRLLVSVNVYITSHCALNQIAIINNFYKLQDVENWKTILRIYQNLETRKPLNKISLITSIYK